MERGRLVVDPRKCTGCRLCEVACSAAHERIFDPAVSRVKVVKVEPIGLDYPSVCRFCGKAACIEACPVGALYRTQSSDVVLLKSDICIMCGACVEACPFGAIVLHPRTRLPIVCDLCSGNPACVARCPTEAIKYVTLREAARTKATQSAEAASRSVLRSWGVKR